MQFSRREATVRRWQGSSLPACLVLFFVGAFAPILLTAQSQDIEKPVPILSGSAGYFNFVTGGQDLIDTQFNPVLLLPLGDRWLVESRAEFEGPFQRPPGGGPYGGPLDKTLDYLQVDYIANPYLTLTVGRFLTPFGIFNERLYPVWIRPLQPDPLNLPLVQESSDGAMLRGGFPVSAAANLNYAVYTSVASEATTGLQAVRQSGGRVGVFFPGPRLEVGGSFAKFLQDGRTNAFGFHMGWQPSRAPLNLRAEYDRSFQGSGYWIEGAYRLSQVHFWQRQMRRFEVAARAQQFFTGQITPAEVQALGLPTANTQEADFGVNYFVKDGLKAVASYGRGFSSAGNYNQWTVGIAYRFLIPLGSTGAQ